RELIRAEQALARHHAENIFSHARLSRLIASTPFGRFEDNLWHREGVFQKINREGMDGYLDFLVAAISQHWSPIYTWEMARERFLNQNRDKEHAPSVTIVLGLLSSIESDDYIAPRFRDRWNRSSRHPFDTVKECMRGVVMRYELEC